MLSDLTDYPLSPFFFVTGPTAVGKTEVAVRLGEVLQQRSGGNCGIEIISADAFQVYAGLDILSAKPHAEQRARVPHHLVGEIPLNQSYSVVDFARQARERMNQLAAAGKWIIVTGGTGFYLRALTHPHADEMQRLPGPDPALREELLQLSPEELLARLLARDSNADTLLDTSNPRRVLRALELVTQTGQPLAELWSSRAGSGASPSTSSTMWPAAQGVILERDREDLRERIDRRTREMFAAGVVEEVRGVLESGLELSATARRMIGLEPIERLLRGEISESACIQQITTVTRRFAKRQRTFFRGQFAEVATVRLRDEEQGSDEFMTELASKAWQHLSDASFSARSAPANPDSP